MEKIYYDVLDKIEKNGFVSYIVGGYVRDMLLNNNTSDVDIITNATPKELNKIFKNIKKEYEEYGAVKIYINNKIIDITTFRKELSYKDGKPDKIEYINSLEDDLKRRDFTINALLLTKEENIIDLLGGKKDLENKIIRTIRDVKEELEEDPVRIIRAIRFMCHLNFKLEDNLYNYIINNKNLIKRVNVVKRKEELDKIFSSSNVQKFIDFIKENNMEEFFGFKVNNFKKTYAPVGVWAQLTLLDDFKFTKNERMQINEIKSLLNKGYIDKIDIYEKGPYIVGIASEILGISKRKISSIYASLPIKNISELNINGEEICDYLNIPPSIKVGKILKEIEKEVVNGNLKNNKDDIIAYLMER